MDEKRKNWMPAIRRATAHQVSSGGVSLGTNSLIMKDPAAFSLIHTGTTSTAAKKFVSQTHGEEYEHSKCVLIIPSVCAHGDYFCVLYRPEKNGLNATSSSTSFFFNHYVLLDLTASRNVFTTELLDFFFLQMTPISNK